MLHKDSCLLRFFSWLVQPPPAHFFMVNQANALPDQPASAAVQQDTEPAQNLPHELEPIALASNGTWLHRQGKLIFSVHFMLIVSLAMLLEGFFLLSLVSIFFFGCIIVGWVSALFWCAIETFYQHVFSVFFCMLWLGFFMKKCSCTPCIVFCLLIALIFA